jgi:hypothetical protein
MSDAVPASFSWFAEILSPQSVHPARCEREADQISPMGLDRNR